MDLKRIGPALCMALGLALTGCSSSNGSNGANGTNADAVGTVGVGPVIVSGVLPADPQESIYVRKVGNGPRTLVLVPGNNTSGACFNGVLDVFRADMDLNAAYTVYTFDYRGSGNSSYNTTIKSLNDFAADFDKVMDKIQDFPKTGVTLVGYSLGFGVALDMLIANPARYTDVVSLTGIGTRGIRVSFNASTAGTDGNGKVWAAGDWIETGNDAAGIVATYFQQRSWQGDQRTLADIGSVWNMTVYNDILQYDINHFTFTDPGGFAVTPAYLNSLNDCLTIQYMPQSLYYAHRFNVSPQDVVAPTPNSDGTTVTIPGTGALGTALAGKNILWVKAATDFATWRGDQVIYDNYAQTSKYDMKRAGATVTAVLIGAGQGYDHGFPIEHPLETVRLLDTFCKGNLSAGTAATALGGAALTLYPSSETSWETSVFTGM
ncbi:MAG: alpha/beta hydrolase [Holophaga sp.]|nr:alpha/beta hydrolase [Holophaga sp.]